MATKLANGWTDYALLTPTKGGKPWKVQINSEGRFRCSCPAFIFQKAPSGERSCKHTRRCEVEYAKEKGLDFVAKVATLPPPTAAVVKNAVVVTRWHEEAKKVTSAMLDSAAIFANERQTEKMVEVLAARLRSFGGVPAPMPTAVASSAAVVVGLRLISFED